MNAWTFSYTNQTGETEIIRGSGNDERNCTIANIAETKLFTWDPEGADQCVSIYRDTTCESMAGYSCTAWRKNASKTFMAFDVMPENLIVSKSEPSSLVSETPTPTSASTSATSTSISSAASTPTPTTSDAAAGNANSGSSGLTGGAIAGVVIGVLAGVAIIIGLVVFFMKRSNKKNVSATPPGSYGPGRQEVDGTGSSMSGTTAYTVKEPLASAGFRPAPGSRLVELKGDEGSAELGSSPISELDGGNCQPRRF